MPIDLMLSRRVAALAAWTVVGALAAGAAWAADKLIAVQWSDPAITSFVA